MGSCVPRQQQESLNNTTHSHDTPPSCSKPLKKCLILHRQHDFPRCFFNLTVQQTLIEVYPPTRLFEQWTAIFVTVQPYKNICYSSGVHWPLLINFQILAWMPQHPQSVLTTGADILLIIASGLRGHVLCSEGISENDFVMHLIKCFKRGPELALVFTLFKLKTSSTTKTTFFTTYTGHLASSNFTSWISQDFR